MMEACKGCLHCEACKAWVRHGKMLYSDFAYSVEECPYFEDRTANGVTVQEWISVNDRLPEQGQEVIAYSGNILSPSVFAYKFWRKDYDTWVHVTHWMPLPEPPKED